MWLKKFKDIFSQQIDPDDPCLKFKLQSGIPYVLQAEDEEYDRGLAVESNEDRTYDIAYWIDEPSNIRGVQVEIDGELVSTDAHHIHIKAEYNDYQDNESDEEVYSSKKDMKFSARDTYVGEQLKLNTDYYTDHAQLRRGSVGTVQDVNLRFQEFTVFFPDTNDSVNFPWQHRWYYFSPV